MLTHKTIRPATVRVAMLVRESVRIVRKLPLEFDEAG